MKAVVLTGTGGPEVLQVREMPDPAVGPGEVRIAVKAAGINFADTMARVGLYPDARSRPACSATRWPARSSRWGRGSSAHKAGDRVIAGTRFGGQAELVTVPRGPGAAAAGAAQLRAGRRLPGQLRHRLRRAGRDGRLKPGERVLIHAAAGGVGISATQIARNIGAEVFGTASPGKHDAIRAQGVEHPIDYRNQDFEAEAMRITGGEGVDVVMDALGPTSFRKDYRLLRPGGRLVMYGLSEVERTAARDIPATLKSLVEDAAGDDALVEEPAGDEREQGGLRPQHAASGGTARAASTGSPSR